MANMSPHAARTNNKHKKNEETPSAAIIYDPQNYKPRRSKISCNIVSKLVLSKSNPPKLTLSAEGILLVKIVHYIRENQMCAFRAISVNHNEIEM